MSNYTVPGFSGDDYDEDDEALKPLTAAQIEARDTAWPEFADGENVELLPMAA